MPNKLTDSEIVKALKSWLEEIQKARQEYLEKVNEEHYPSIRYEYLLSDTINEINRLQAENERLKNILICFMGALGKVRNIDDIESISQIPIMTELNKGIRAEIKAEAYKEFWKELYVEMRMYGQQEKFTKSVFLSVADKVLKELVGDSE